jgi:quercetin dioxygenase-like cupin family protein
LDVFLVDKTLSGPSPLRLNPLKTSRVMFSVYRLQPWQALGMHRHPASEEVFYVIEGRCRFYVEGEARDVGVNHAVYIPEGAMHAVLSCSRATLLSIQGPQPVMSVYGKGLEYFCPVCRLEAPLPVGKRTGDREVCPRCKAVLKLTEAGEAFEAVPVEAGPEEARA